MPTPFPATEPLTPPYVWLCARLFPVVGHGWKSCRTNNNNNQQEHR